MFIKSCAVLAIALLAPFSHGQETAEDRINQCKGDSSTLQTLGGLLQTVGRAFQDPQYVFPFVEPFGRVYPNIGNADLGDGKLESYQWFSNVIPHELNQGVPGVTPNPDSPQVTPPFINALQEDINSWAFKKFPATPPCFLAFTARGLPGNDDFTSTTTSVFLADKKDRGSNDLIKRQYMSALTCDKLEFYESKVENALEAIHDAVEDGGVPLLSTTKEIMIDLYISIHLGDADHPPFVREYFSLLTDFVSDIGRTCSVPKFDVLISGFCQSQEMVRYVEERLQIVRDPATEDKSNFIYWWAEAGMDTKRLIREAAHNVLAFSQLTNTLFLTVVANIPGFGGYLKFQGDNLYSGNVQIPAPTIDFFDKYNTATTAEERINVAREVFRLLMPNNFWLSSLETPNSSNDGKAYASADYDFTSTSHIPFMIQVVNDEFDPATGQTQAGVYDTSRYDSFPASGGCPFKKSDILTVDDFVTSNVDGETVIPLGHEHLIPVFESGDPSSVPINGPKYCSFGLGYRRCPSELFNIFFIEKMLEKLGDLEFKQVGDVFLLGRGVPSTDPAFDTAVPTGLFRRLDNIFVDA